ncbi:hypothetical protein HYN69_20275 (plasmid) [Gemmobacter aquarius]|uniref:Uncharacterized protein n=1 Tax=Paragemmobacter aquarius TaxID=2169400 RepID=A0A2S0USY4_9RHOB|nr:hypothetical protein HYN69_20275 [Gemmobacter aquarius]
MLKSAFNHANGHLQNVARASRITRNEEHCKDVTIPYAATIKVKPWTEMEIERYTGSPGYVLRWQLAGFRHHRQPNDDAGGIVRAKAIKRLENLMVGSWKHSANLDSSVKSRNCLVILLQHLEPRHAFDSASAFFNQTGVIPDDVPCFECRCAKMVVQVEDKAAREAAFESFGDVHCAVRFLVAL